MFSLNVPLPPAVDRLAADLHPKLTGFDRIRERRTLVAKRFGADDVPGGRRRNAPKDAALAALREELRPCLAGTAPLELAITGVDAFELPARGAGPVVYLVVESDALVRLHRRLCAAFDAIEGIEGEDYVPHVTLARGGAMAPVDDLRATDVDPIRWRADELSLYDPEFREVAGRMGIA